MRFLQKERQKPHVRRLLPVSVRFAAELFEFPVAPPASSVRLDAENTAHFPDFAPLLHTDGKPRLGGIPLCVVRVVDIEVTALDLRLCGGVAGRAPTGAFTLEGRKQPFGGSLLVLGVFHPLAADFLAVFHRGGKGFLNEFGVE